MNRKIYQDYMLVCVCVYSISYLRLVGNNFIGQIPPFTSKPDPLDYV